MSDAADTQVDYSQFVQCLKSIAWCKQGEKTLVAVHKCSPEMIEVLAQGPVKVFPGAVPVKPSKSWISTLAEKYDDGFPVPLLLVWREEGLELWYRRHKSSDFPYDAWSDPVAAAYEREQVCITGEQAGSSLLDLYAELISRAPACPASIPGQ